MLSERYYVDTCVWLNLFKEEKQISNGKPAWAIALNFIETINHSEIGMIIYSDVILRELQIKLGDNSFQLKRRFIESQPRGYKAVLTTPDKELARKLESQYQFNISYYDLAHLAISKRLNAILVTRDKDLLSISKEHGVDSMIPDDIKGLATPKNQDHPLKDACESP